MAVAFIALFVALVGTAYSVGSQVPGKGGVKASDIAKGAVKTKKIANGAVTSAKIADEAVTSGKFFLSVVQNHDFAQVPASNCTGSGFQSPPSLTISTPGITATDHVVVTPPPGFADTFVLTGIPDPANNRVVVAACNNFFAGSGDPDGGGGPYKVLVIR
jgi:hypothetical protein